MKSLSSQLNRGTELLKQTVQRAIFSTATVASTSSKIIVVPPPTAKPTPYHSDPHAVLRSSSVDSLHLEMCHVRPIRPYTLTPYKRKTGASIRIPLVHRPENGLAVKFLPIKAKARFKLQKGNQLSAFCSLQAEPPQQQKQPKSSPKKATKRKRSLPEEEDCPELVIIEDEEEEREVRGKKAVKQVKKSITTGKSKVRAKPDTKKTTKAAKRKSTEQEKQEREDFEMAKKLQREFDSNSTVIGDTNASNGNARRTTRNGRSANNSVTTNYSLRTTRSLSKISSSVSPPMIEEERNKTKDFPQTKNGLRNRNVMNGSKSFKAGNGDALKDHQKKQQQQPVGKRKTSTKSVGRATRSKVNGGLD